MLPGNAQDSGQALEFLAQTEKNAQVAVAGERGFRDMKREGEYGRCALPSDDLGWRERTVHLSPWRGQEVELQLLLHTDDAYNTWVYTDDVSVR